MSADTGGAAPRPGVAASNGDFDPDSLGLPEGWTVAPPPGPAPLTPAERAAGARVLADEARQFAEAVQARLDKYREHAEASVAAMEARLDEARADADAAEASASDLEAQAEGDRE